MQLPTWTKPALSGAAAGAVALAFVGFTWGGWTTAGAAEERSKKDSRAAVVAALTPYCLERSAADPNAVTLIAELKGTTSTFERKGIVEKAGWATPLGADKPNTELAQACQVALAEAI